MRIVFPQVAQARNKSIGEHWHCCVTFEIWGFVWGKKTIVSVTYENVRISIKKVDLILHKMCGRLSCVVHGPIYSRFMPGFYCKRFSLYNTTLAFTLYFECYATMPMLADAHISSMGYLWYFWNEFQVSELNISRTFSGWFLTSIQ